MIPRARYCPWCDSEPMLINKSYSCDSDDDILPDCWVQCDACGARGPNCLSPSDAVVDWNKVNVAVGAEPKVIEALLKALSKTYPEAQIQFKETP